MTAVEPRRQQGQSVPLQPQMTGDEARDLTEQVRRDFGVLWNKVLDLYERGAHLALDYPTWGQYWQAEFGVSGARGEQLVRAGRVARELERHGLPLPANDSAARVLLPVLKYAPDELPNVWQQALDAHGERPNARQIKPLVEPYKRYHIDSETVEEARLKRAQTKRDRNHLAHAIDDGRGAAEAALASIEAALRTNPTDAVIEEWREGAKIVAQKFMELAQKLRANGG